MAVIGSTCTPALPGTAHAWRAARRARAVPDEVHEPFPWDVDALLRRCAPPVPLPMGGMLLRQALSEKAQQWLYTCMHALADHESEEIASLRSTQTPADMAALNPDNRPQPFVTWTHPYTRLSNTRQRPGKLLEWAERLMHALVPDSHDHSVDSMLAQLYSHGGSLLPHRDEDLSWGIGVSLGSTAVFECLPAEGSDERAQRVLIHSGDVLVGEFGQMPHAVSVPSDERPPSWWSEVDTFGTKVRCNVLFRQALTEKQQLALAHERAQKVYGISLAQLKEQTGKDEAFLAVHLRHAALD